jgi:hypothetical protein
LEAARERGERSSDGEHDLPMCCEDSINACAAAASASGNTRWTTGFTTPPSSIGQTFARNEFAIAALRSVGLARKVEPVTVRRRIMM